MRLLFLSLLVAVVVLGPRPFSHPDQANAENTTRVFIDLPTAFNANDDAAVRNAGGRVRHQFLGGRTISVEVPANLLPVLERVDRFNFIRPVPPVIAVEDTLPWGINRVDAERVWGGAEGALNVVSGANCGSGSRIAVIDTGVGPHADLTVSGGISYVSSSYADDNGHGTHVAGIAAAKDNGSGVIGIAPCAGLLSVKVLDSSGGGYMDDVAAGVTWAAQNGADVINLSLTCTGSSSACNNSVMQNALQTATNAGVVIVAAAGNSGGEVGWPAQDDRTIAVSATNSNNVIASFSSRGSAVDLAAPGDGIYSTWPNGGFQTLSGTSMATPHVAGAAALLAACGQSGSQIRSTLQSTADDLGAAGKDSNYGYGLLDVDGAVTCGGNSTPPPPPSPSCSAAVCETFESGNWSGGSGWSGAWSRSGSNSAVISSSGPQAGSYHMELRSNSSITRTFSLSGLSSATLMLWAKANSWESSWFGGSDGAAIQVSTNGSSWTTLRSFTNGFDNNTYQQLQFNLDQWAGQSTVYLRILGQMSATNDYFYADSIQVSGTTSSPPAPDTTPPNPPSGLSATGGNGQIALTWTPSSSSDVTQQRIYRGTSSGNYGASPIATLSAGANSYTNTGLTNGTTYYYVVRAFDGTFESSNSNQASAAPAAPADTPPAAPTGLTATAGDGQVSLNWADNSESDLAGYNVYRSTANGGPYSKINGATVGPSAYTDTGLTNGTTYYYVVTAVDVGANESGNSAQVSATPSAPPPASCGWWQWWCR